MINSFKNLGKNSSLMQKLILIVAVLFIDWGIIAWLEFSFGKYSVNPDDDFTNTMLNIFVPIFFIYNVLAVIFLYHLFPKKD